MSTTLARALCSTLKNASDPVYAPGKAAYLKNVCTVYGLKADAQRDAFNAHLPSMLELFQTQGKPAIYALSREMFTSTVHEEKQCGYMILHYVLDKKPSRLDLDDLTFLGKDVFDRDLAYDWATVDSICGKVLHNIISNESHSRKPGEILRQWAKEGDKKWKQRAACVAYVKLAKHGEHTDDIVAIVDDVIKNQERFAQLGAGWVLRELWLAEPQLVVDFITDRYHHFTREGLAYAIEKMDSSLRDTLRRYDPSKGQKVVVKSSKAKPAEDDDEDFEAPKKARKSAVKMVIEADEVPATKKRAAPKTKLETKPKAKKAKML